MAGPGRPTKYTPELGLKIAGLIGEGATRGSAARSQGIAIPTFYEWLNKFPAFAEAVTRAESQMLVECAQSLVRGAKEDPKWALEVLKRRERLEWQEAAVMDLTSGGQPLKITLNIGDGSAVEDDADSDSAEE